LLAGFLSVGLGGEEEVIGFDTENDFDSSFYTRKRRKKEMKNICMSLCLQTNNLRSHDQSFIDFRFIWLIRDL